MRRILITSIVLCISIVTNAQSPSEPGYYYDASGQKMSGLIDFLPGSDHILFRANKNDHPVAIYINNISSMVLNNTVFKEIDSVIVISEDNKESKKYFAQFYFATATTKFYWKIITGGSGEVPPKTSLTTITNVPNSTNNGVHNITFMSASAPRPAQHYTKQLLMYQEGNTTYELTKGNYVKVLSNAFADQPDLVKRIQNKEVKFNYIYEIFDAYKKIKKTKTDDGNLDSLFQKNKL